jgi:hypothetical protein
MDLREIVWEDVDWMHLAEDWGRWRALVNSVMDFPGPIKGGKFTD